MAREWDAQFEVTEDLAISLLADQFPEMSPQTAKYLGAGYDNTAFLVDGTWVVRFPRRPVGVQLLEIETRVLPDLQRHLPLPIPSPAILGRSTDAFPHPFAGYRMIPGETADRMSLSDHDRERSAPVLGRFLRSLHAIPTSSTSGVPPDEIRRADLTYRIPWLRDRAARSSDARSAAENRCLLSFLDQIELMDLPPGKPVIVHGDLYSRHLLFNQDKELCGVIDWGDVHMGDPALDAGIAYSFLPASSRSAFWEAYGDVDESFHLRARFKALLYGVILVEYGTDIGDPQIANAGRLAISLFMSDL